MRSATFGSDAGRARHHGLVAQRNGGGEIGGLERAEHGQRDLGADALHGLQQAEPFALDVGQEAEQPDLVLAHMGLDRQRRALAGAGQLLQRARGAVHEIADAVDVEDDEILAVAVDHALELADHASAYLAATATAAPAIMVPPVRLSRRMARVLRNSARARAAAMT